MTRWCVFISGTGSNLRALLDCQSMLPISCIVSQKPQVRGLFHARSFGVPHIILESQINWEGLTNKLKQIGITHIFLAGFMKVLPPEFIQEWGGRIFNIHPSLLPHYPGLRSLEKAFQEKGPLGLTIHRVTEGVDEGPRLLQKKIPYFLDLESTEISAHSREHSLVRSFAQLRLL